MLPCLCDYDGVFFVFVVVVVSFFFVFFVDLFINFFLFLHIVCIHFSYFKKKGEMSAPTLRHYFSGLV